MHIDYIDSDFLKSSILNLSWTNPASMWLLRPSGPGILFTEYFHIDLYIIWHGCVGIVHMSYVSSIDTVTHVRLLFQWSKVARVQDNELLFQTPPGEYGQGKILLQSGTASRCVWFESCGWDRHNDEDGWLVTGMELEMTMRTSLSLLLLLLKMWVMQYSWRRCYIQLCNLGFVMLQIPLR